MSERSPDVDVVAAGQEHVGPIAAEVAHQTPQPRHDLERAVGIAFADDDGSYVRVDHPRQGRLSRTRGREQDEIDRVPGGREAVGEQNRDSIGAALP